MKMCTHACTHTHTHTHDDKQYKENEWVKSNIPCQKQHYSMCDIIDSSTASHHLKYRIVGKFGGGKV